MKFVLLVGVLSFFADFTYEGARSIVGPYLSLLHASATTVGIIAGLGELLGYGLRLVSGRMADSTQKFWPITIVGYVVQMSAVPLLALAGNWQIAAVFIILERVGKAARNPPRDAMLSHAAERIGYGWAFGVHEALDQFGATFGPLLVALVLAIRGDYRMAFAVLLIPGLICLGFVFVARWLYPKPEDMEAVSPHLDGNKLPALFWIYLGGAALVAAGFSDYALIGYHFAQTSVVSVSFIPILYAVAMAVSGTGSLVFGRLYDRFGFSVVIVLTLIATVSAPMVFLGNFWIALVGAAMWGLGIGSHESLIPAVVGPMVSPQRRASAYGLFTGVYGLAWFAGSAVMGLLYDVSLPMLIGFSVTVQLLAVPLFILVLRRR